MGLCSYSRDLRTLFPRSAWKQSLVYSSLISEGSTAMQDKNRNRSKSSYANIALQSGPGFLLKMGFKLLSPESVLKRFTPGQVYDQI